MKKQIKYKLVYQDGYTRRGLKGETYWLDGLEKIATGQGNELCTADLIHYYDHPLLSVLFNPVHANFENPRLIEIEIDKECAHDGLKGGCKKAKFTKEVKLPKITTEQKVTFAIKISLEFYKDKDYGIWAKNWLNGKDRSSISAEIAAWAVSAAAWAAVSAATRAAVSAAESAAARGAISAEINKLFIKTITNIVGK